MARPAPEVTMVNVPDTHNLHMCPGILDPVLQNMQLCLQMSVMPPVTSQNTICMSHFHDVVRGCIAPCRKQLILLF